MLEATRFITLFQPDTLLPVQYLETIRRKDHLQPEKKLMLAVLEDALWTYRKCLLSQPIRFFEVEDWFLDTDNEWLFSFESVCAILGLSCNHLRRRLLGPKWNDPRLRNNIRRPLSVRRGRPPRSINANIWHNRKHENRRPRAGADGLLWTAVTVENLTGVRKDEEKDTYSGRPADRK